MFNHVKDCFGTYPTTRQVKINSVLLAVTYWVIVILVWVAYIGSLRLDPRNVYQKTCSAEGAIVSKVKGQFTTEHLEDSEFRIPNPELYKRVWDTSDLIFPPYGGDGQDGSFIAVTNLMITPNQTRGHCAESNKKIAACSDDKDCIKGTSLKTSNGVFTGKCLNETKICEVSAWCPVEQRGMPLKADHALLEGVQNFTIMLKNSVEFPECGPDYHKRNILENPTKEYLANCIYDKENDTLCPIFKLGDIIQWSGSNFSEVAATGGVFRIEANWQCDFDTWGFEEKWCFPTYKFERIDEKNAKISPGWNFRASFYHEEHRRTLTKMVGIKVLVLVSGNGKKFDFLQLILALGATIGLFSVAPLVCDSLFELMCHLKKYAPFKNICGDFSVKARYQNATASCRPKSTSNKFELSARNVDEEKGSYKSKPTDVNLGVTNDAFEEMDSHKPAELPVPANNLSQ